MNFLKRLLGLGGKPRADSTGVVVEPDAVWVYVKCDRCGEPIEVRLSRTSVFQQAEPGEAYEWFVNKTVVGNSSRCFNRMDLRIELDRRYRPVHQSVVGGTFISKAEYEGKAAGRKEERVS
ncbi:MAG: hypothetical protein GX030_10815 [Firmicutes bacterium]|nr:hypothetical protein [Bacillota bacterium]